MAKHKVLTTDAEIDRAIAAAAKLSDEPRVIAADYKPGPGLNLLILKLSNGQRRAIPVENIQGLRHATKAQIAQVRITGNGTGLHWPALDLDHSVPNLLRDIYGTRQWMAEIGRRGGATTSPAKRKSARANGRKGGRPRKLAIAG
ncbi:MAG: DUF2442 domain-containing protein [Acidobacteriaceae bacterium]|jgi:hypothetical protein